MIDLSEAGAAAGGFLAAFGAFRVSAQRELRETVRYLREENAQYAERISRLEAVVSDLKAERQDLQEQLFRALTNRKA